MSLADILTDIANAIRGKTGTTGKLKLEDMAEAVNSIPDAGEVPYIDSSDVAQWAYFFYKNYRTDLLDKVDTSSGVTFDYFMAESDSITKIPSGMVFGKGLSFNYAFRGTGIRILPKIPVSMVSANGLCQGCTSLISVNGVDFSGGGTANNVFNGCTNLTTVERLVLPKISTWFINAFNNCSNLEKVIAEGSIEIVNNNFKMNYSDKLTVESMMSFINAFKDNTGGTTYTVYFGTANIDKLSEEQKQIATDKNINLG